MKGDVRIESEGCHCQLSFILITNSPHFECSHQYQDREGDIPRKWYDLPLQQVVMEYHHTGVGIIVQSTWWVQCTNVHVVCGYVNRKGH